MSVTDGDIHRKLHRTATVRFPDGYIDLDRRFADLENGSMDEAKQLAAIEGLLHRTSLSWNDLLESERVVILAEAGSGKTLDLQAQAARLIAADKPAFFVRLEALNTESLRDILAMEPDALERFDRWKSDEQSMAWLFLDAVDELKLTTGTLDRALGKVSRDVAAARERLRVLVTCRPTDWRPVEDRQTLLRWLPTSDPQRSLQKSLDSEEGFLAHLEPKERTGEDAQKQPPEPPPKLRFAALLPLNRERILTFATAVGVNDPKAFYAEIERQESLAFARRPLDLRRLARSWVLNKTLGTLREQHEDDVEQSLIDKPDRPDAGNLTAEMAREGAERLALALALTRRRAVCDPDDIAIGDSRDDVLHPGQVLKNWTPAQIGTLLRRPIFDPATYGRAQFHHRSVQEYLAARRLLKLREQGLPIRQLHRLLFADTYGEKVVIPSMAPIAAWVAQSDEIVARELLARQPEILVLQGDPESLAGATRRELIQAFVANYGPGDWRGLRVPIAEARRLSGEDMVPTIRECWVGQHSNNEVYEFLLMLILAGKLHDCVDLAFDAVFDTVREPGTRHLAVQVLADAGRVDLMRRVTEQMIAQPSAWPDRTLIYSADDLFPQAMTADELLSLVKHVPQPNSATSGFAYSLYSAARWTFDPLAPSTTALRDAIAALVWDARNTRDRHYPSSIYAYLCPALTVLCLNQAKSNLGTPNNPGAIRPKMIHCR